MRFFFSFAFFIFLTATEAAPKPLSLETVFSKYQGASLVKMDVKKKVKSELMGKTQIFDGQIFISQKLFRWDVQTPEKSLIVFDGKSIWNVQYPPAEFKSPPNIAKMKLDQKSGKQILIATLLNKSSLNKNFKILSAKAINGSVDYSLEPKTTDLSIKNLNVKVDSKKKQIQKISYVDDLGNLTEIEISKTTFLKKSNPQLFRFSPPKGAAVTHL